MTDRTTWLALAERCETATGPDRIIDGLIYMAMQSNPPAYWEASASGLIWAWNSPPPHPAGTGGRWACPDEFTASLDATTALIERELPGWHGDVEVGFPLKGDGIYVARLFSRDCGDDEEWGDVADAVEVEAATPALALCAAFCRAMAENGGRADG